MTPHQWADVPEKGEFDGPFKWVTCLVCGSTIIIRADDAPSEWWKGWKGLYEDCLVTQAANILES